MSDLSLEQFSAAMKEQSEEIRRGSDQTVSAIERGFEGLNSTLKYATRGVSNGGNAWRGSFYACLVLIGSVAAVTGILSVNATESRAENKRDAIRGDKTANEAAMSRFNAATVQDAQRHETALLANSSLHELIISSNSELRKQLERNEENWDVILHATLQKQYNNGANP